MTFFFNVFVSVSAGVTFERSLFLCLNIHFAFYILCFQSVSDNGNIVLLWEIKVKTLQNVSLESFKESLVLGFICKMVIIPVYENVLVLFEIEGWLTEREFCKIHFLFSLLTLEFSCKSKFINLMIAVQLHTPYGEYLTSELMIIIIKKIIYKRLTIQECPSFDVMMIPVVYLLTIYGLYISNIWLWPTPI